MIDLDLLDGIDRDAKEFGLPANLVAAIVLTESNGDRYATRFEPHYGYLWDVDKRQAFRALTEMEKHNDIAPGDFPYFKHSSRNTEWIGQQMSWGCMQVMGAVARELGFNKPFAHLCNPVHGVYFGCFLLNRLKRRFYQQYGWDGVIAAYNAGSPRRNGLGEFVNADYVKKVNRYKGHDQDWLPDDLDIA